MCLEVMLQWDKTLTDRDQVSHTRTGIYLEQTPPPQLSCSHGDGLNP